MKKARFLLDASLSPSLGDFLRGGVTMASDALRNDADDLQVIGLAYDEGALLVTTDKKIANKCVQYQSQRGCMYGLLILPDGTEIQNRILQDLLKGKKSLRFHEIDHPLTWAKISDYNFLVRAQPFGHPHVSELCKCQTWRPE